MKRSSLMTKSMTVKARRASNVDGLSIRSVSDPIGAVAFFTETPSTETVWTLTVVKVLMISRQFYEVLQHTHPRQVQVILSNLKNHWEKALLDVLNGEMRSLERVPALFEQLRPCMRNGAFVNADFPAQTLLDIKDALPVSKADLVEKHSMIRALIETYFKHKDQELTTELLDASAKGDVEALRKLLASGTSPNKGDYDKRTALMVSAQEGKESVVKMLLEAGADANALDIFGTNALVGAVRAGHGQAMQVLLAHGASLADCTDAVRADVIGSILKGDMALLTRYLDAGTDPNLTDHHRSTLLHVAAAEGNMAAVKLLLAAGADVLLADRWGNRALDDARRAEAMPVVRLLEPLVTKFTVARSSGVGAVRMSLSSIPGEDLELVEIGASSVDAQDSAAAAAAAVAAGESGLLQLLRGGGGGSIGVLTRELLNAGDGDLLRRGLFPGMAPADFEPSPRTPRRAAP